MKYKAYIGTYSIRKSRGIYIADTDSKTGDMHIFDSYNAFNPSYLAISKDCNYLFSVLETKEIDGHYGGAVISFSINQDATLNLVSKAYTLGTDPCHLTTDKKDTFLYVANYSDGKLTVLPLNNGAIINEPLVIEHWNSDLVNNRLKNSHAHCTMFDRNGRLCMVDLGLDKAIFYNVENNILIEECALVTKLGSGPRHVVFSSNGCFAWIVCEHSNEIYTFDLISMQRIGIYTTLPGDFKGSNTCAAIKISPCGEFIYASNRGHNSIAVFQIEKNGKLKLVGNYFSRGKTPRDFAFSPNGKFLYIANQNSDSIEVFLVRAGRLEYTGQSISVPAPCCIIFR